MKVILSQSSRVFMKARQASVYLACDLNSGDDLFRIHPGEHCFLHMSIRHPYLLADRLISRRPKKC